MNLFKVDDKLLIDRDSISAVLVKEAIGVRKPDNWQVFFQNKHYDIKISTDGMTEQEAKNIVSAYYSRA